MLNSNQRLVLFRQTQTISSHRNLDKHNSKVFQAFDSCLVAFYENNNKSSLKRSLTNLVFQPETKLNFSSNNPNNFYILTSSTIIDKCTIVRDLCKLFQQDYLPTNVSSSSPDRTYTYSYYVGI